MRPAAKALSFRHLPKTVARWHRTADLSRQDTALRRYVAVNQDRWAAMGGARQLLPDGAKQFTIISEEGSKSIRKHAFPKC
jgi:hypothetical protein